MANDPEGYVLCAWCNKVLAWAGPETVYSLCKECVPLARQAFVDRAAAARAQAADAPPPGRRAAGRGK